MGRKRRSAPVLRVITASAHGYPRVLQEFADTIFALKIPSHPNIVRPVGVTMDPLQVVVEQESDENLVVGYLKEHPEANRIGLVSPLLLLHLTDDDNVVLFRVVGCR